MNVVCSSYIYLNNSDASNSDLTQILEEQESENEIDLIVNVEDFNIRLSHFLLKYKEKFKLDFPKENHKLFLKAMNNNLKLLKKINFDNNNELKSEQVIYSNE